MIGKSNPYKSPTSEPETSSPRFRATSWDALVLLSPPLVPLILCGISRLCKSSAIPEGLRFLGAVISFGLESSLAAAMSVSVAFAAPFLLSIDSAWLRLVVLLIELFLSILVWYTCF